LDLRIPFWLDKPLPADSFEGSITNGSLLLVVETDKKDLRQKAIECFGSSNAVGVIAQFETIGALEAVTIKSEPQVGPASVQLAA
jgi:hypothetical protein